MKLRPNAIIDNFNGQFVFFLPRRVIASQEFNDISSLLLLWNRNEWSRERLIPRIEIVD